MARANFLSIFTNPDSIFKKWYSAKQQASSSQPLQRSVLVAGRNDPDVAAALNASKGDAVISLKQLAEYFQDSELKNFYNSGDISQAKTIYDEIQKAAQQLSNIVEIKVATSASTGIVQQQLLLKDISFKNAAETVDRQLKKIVNIINTGQKTINLPEQSFSEFVKSKKLQTGHVFGFANALSRNTVAEVNDFLTKYIAEQKRQAEINNIDRDAAKQKEKIAQAIAAIDATEKAMREQIKYLDGFLDDIENILLAFDEETSQLSGIGETELYANYRKNHSRWLWEFQPGNVNLAAGTAVGVRLGKKSYSKFGEDTAKTLRGFFQQAVTAPNTADQALGRLIESFVSLGKTPGKFSFLEQKGSATLKDFILDSITSKLAKQPKKFKEVVESRVKLPNVTTRKVSRDATGIKKADAVLKQTKNNIKKVKSVLNTAIAKTKNKKQILLQAKSETNLTNLQSLLNAGLYEQIRKNMGTGNRRDVLNFQSGRFAESASVERLSESRQGMITAFYSYMKYPYATFSRGGLQERPYTRDPKTLISKSIRELAGPLVANRMRAVLV